MQKHALVLGATASLGDVLCDQLATQGWRLTLAGRDEKAAYIDAATFANSLWN